MEKKNQIIKVRDLNEASLLKMKGYEIKGMDWNNGVASWLFDDKDEEIDSIIQQYVNGKITGNIKKFSEAQQTLKKMLFQ